MKNNKKNYSSAAEMERKVLKCMGSEDKKGKLNAI